MPDYARDVREVIRRGKGSELGRQVLLRKWDRLQLDLRRGGVDLNGIPQRDLCDAMSRDKEDSREWMFRLCVARLARCEYSDWTGWEYRNEFAMGSYHPDVPNKRWRLEPIQSIAVLGEQGVGDEIMFASCLGDLVKRVPDVVYECDPRISPIIARSLPVRSIPRTDIEKRGDPVVKYLTNARPEEAFTLAGDLPRLLRKSLSDFPREAFLKPLPEYVEKWSKYKGRVGTAWRSRTGSFKPSELGVKDAVCLQYDVWEGHVETEGMEVPDIHLRNDIEDLLGICANLEKVVCCPNTVVHLAGSIGTKVEVVIPPVGTGRIADQYRYRYTDPMPWYANVKVFPNLHAYLHR